jgi:hypothetical protein
MWLDAIYSSSPGMRSRILRPFPPEKQKTIAELIQARPAYRPLTPCTNLNITLHFYEPGLIPRRYLRFFKPTQAENSKALNSSIVIHGP